MILLNQPWAYYERQLDRDRRRQAARHSLRILLFSAAYFLLGMGIGALIRF